MGVSMEKLRGERNIEWLGRINARLAEVEEQLDALPPRDDSEVPPGTEFPDVSNDPRAAPEDEGDRLQAARLEAVAAAQRDGDL